MGTPEEQFDGEVGELSFTASEAAAIRQVIAELEEEEEADEQAAGGM